MSEIVAMVMSGKAWLEKSIEMSKSNKSWAIIPYSFLSILFSIMFPTEAYITAFFVLVIAICLDTIVKIYSEAKQNRRFMGIVTSRKLWSGISGKLFVLTILSILLGLLNSVESLYIVSVCLFTVFYGVLILREIYSILENLYSAGHTQVDVFLKIVKYREKQLLKENNINIDDVK